MDKQKLWEIRYLWLRRAWCFIVGHKEVCGNPLEDDWCSRCLVDWPQDKMTMPVILNRCYCWAVEHGWPEWLDLWLQDYVRLPRWWEY